MVSSKPQSGPLHLQAGCAAVILLLMLCLPLLSCLEAWSSPAEEASIPTLMRLKNQGLSLMEHAVLRADVLPLFGSSELFLERENRPDCFFQNSPTGFKVCPIGAPGNTCLPTAEKIAALGHLIKGKKLAIMLSFRWFSFAQALPEEYVGNFSLLHAGALAVNDSLTPPLRQKFASRMQQYPATLDERPALRIFLASQTHGDAFSHGLQPVLSSWLSLQNRVDRLQDRFESAYQLLRSPSQPSVTCTSAQPPINWSKIRGPQPPAMSLEDYPEDIIHADLDEKSRSFVSRLDASKEWQDLELLLDTLKHLQGTPLILCIPLDGKSMDSQGIGSVARSHFYRRVEHLCAAHGFPCESFLSRDCDPDFIEGDGHPTPHGWLSINEKLDDFYHDRLSPEATRPLSQE